MSRYLVTGATSGVGFEVALTLRAAGHNVECVARSGMKLHDINQREDIPNKLFGRELDFEIDSPAKVSELIKAWTHPDVTVGFDGIFHAAGTELVLPLRLTSDEHYRKAMTFADSSFAILRAAASKGVMKDGGSIVLMSSVAAHRGTAGMAAYSAARAAVEAMARCAAAELSVRRIRVNCVAAGAFGTAMHERVVARMPESAREGYEKAHPLGFGPVDAVRDAVLHLLGPQSAWTTGTVMVVDGGYLHA